MKNVCMIAEHPYARGLYKVVEIVGEWREKPILMTWPGMYATIEQAACAIEDAGMKWDTCYEVAVRRNSNGNEISRIKR